jgi:hypothetical protein
MSVCLLVPGFVDPPAMPKEKKHHQAVVVFQAPGQGRLEKLPVIGDHRQGRGSSKSQ